jgi:hypothetical protein
MTASAAPPVTPSPAVGAQAWARAVLERQAMMLDRLAEGGMRMAEAIRTQTERHIEPEAPPASGPTAPSLAELSRSYARVARAVRLTLMLQAKLVADRLALDEPACAPAGPRLRALRLVKRAAQAEHEDGQAVERLVREAAERLDREDVCAELLSRPTHEVIAFICREMNLDPDWPRLAQEAWEEVQRQADTRPGQQPPPKPPPKSPAEPQTMTFRWLEPGESPPPPLRPPRPATT